MNKVGLPTPAHPPYTYRVTRRMQANDYDATYYTDLAYSKLLQEVGGNSDPPLLYRVVQILRPYREARISGAKAPSVNILLLPPNWDPEFV